MTYDVIVIGSSAGGVSVLRRLLTLLPPRLDAAVFIVQHRPASTSDHLLEVLRSALGPNSQLTIREAVNGHAIRTGEILIAPADEHLLLGTHTVQVHQGPMENMVRPAIDPLFRSAALTFGPRVMGIVLSGELDDGSLGLISIARCGGLAVVQDPDEAAYPSMPRNALERNDHARRLSIDEIAQLISGPRTHVGPAVVPALMPGLAQEVDMARGQRDFHEDLDQLGTPSGLTCPECQGSLWRVSIYGADQYRCHISHAYTEAALEAGQIQAQERALGSALKTLEERIRIYQTLSDRLHARRPHDPPSRFDEMIVSLSEDARQLRRMLWRAEPANLPTAPDPITSSRGGIHDDMGMIPADTDDRSER